MIPQRIRKCDGARKTDLIPPQIYHDDEARYLQYQVTHPRCHESLGLGQESGSVGIVSKVV